MTAADATGLQTVRVLLVEGVPIIREGLLRILTERLGVGYVHPTATLARGMEALHLLNARFAILDRDATDRDVFACVERAAHEIRDLRVALTSMQFSDLDLQRAVERRIAGCLLKTDEVEQLTTGLGQALRGEEYFSPRLGERLRLLARSSAAVGLSAVERAVLTHLSRGHGPREVAEIVGLSAAAVEELLSGLVAKLGVADRDEAIRYAVRERLISVGDDSS
jgi:DNA-binding NarL/FixJ family response regulator